MVAPVVWDPVVLEAVVVAVLLEAEALTEALLQEIPWPETARLGAAEAVVEVPLALTQQEATAAAVATAYSSVGLFVKTCTQYIPNTKKCQCVKSAPQSLVYINKGAKVPNPVNPEKEEGEEEDAFSSCHRTLEKVCIHIHLSTNVVSTILEI